jgi:oligopeptide transport system permease protein
VEIENRKLTPDLFESAELAAMEGERIADQPVGFWKDSWSRLKKNRGLSSAPASSSSSSPWPS